eukprot:1152382-Pelagomonas_calceolata.AAC.2
MQARRVKWKYDAVERYVRSPQPTFLMDDQDVTLTLQGNNWKISLLPAKMVRSPQATFMIQDQGNQNVTVTWQGKILARRPCQNAKEPPYDIHDAGPDQPGTFLMQDQITSQGMLPVEAPLPSKQSQAFDEQKDLNNGFNAR